MKYNKNEIEIRWKNLWATENIFAFDISSKLPIYIVDTPPPYVSADHLHAGHIMSYAQAEFIVRYKRMRGYNVYYPMGFDDNGLPTERYIEKKYNIDKKTITRPEFVKLCLEETKKGSANYQKLWQDLGVSVDWNYTYSTIDRNSQLISQKSFIELYNNKHLYREEKPVMWCTNCQTTLVQADLEDIDRESEFVYIKLAIDDNNSITFATTRPEMYPSCVGISVNPNVSRYKSLIGKTVIMPITASKIIITSDEKVDPKFGTGVVYYCSSGDMQFLDWESRHPVDDSEKKYIIDSNGLMNDKAGRYKGLTIIESKKQIIEDLKSLGFIDKIENIKQTVKVHERCETPIEYISSKQWFIRISEQKDTWLELGKNVKWYPKNRYSDYENWVKGLSWDWCISRQRYYGVPIPVWYSKKTGEPILASIEELPVDPTQYTPKGYDADDLIAEKDVLDTWATSSLSPQIIQSLIDDNPIKDQIYPATLRPNAFEIIRTWDFYSIVRGYYYDGSLPFDSIMISGHGLAEDGRKLSKRLDNYIPSEELIEKYGADAIRYWATGARLGQNLRFSNKEVEMGHKTAVKLFNVARLLSIHIDSANKNYELDYSDVWILKELNKTIESVTDAFETYSYSIARDILDGFFWSKFTDYYVEFIKYRLFGEDIISKSAAVSTLQIVLLSIIKMYAPIMPFITEQIYQDLYYNDNNQISIHLSNWPNRLDINSKYKTNDFDEVIGAIDEIRKYKSNNEMSMGHEIEEYSLVKEINMKKYSNLICGVMRVKKLNIKTS